MTPIASRLALRSRRASARAGQGGRFGRSVAAPMHVALAVAVAVLPVTPASAGVTGRAAGGEVGFTRATATDERTWEGPPAPSPAPDAAAPPAGARGDGEAEASPPTTDAAASELDPGDLRGAYEAAVAARQASATIDTWAAEGEAARALGDYAAALAAYTTALELAEAANDPRATALGDRVTSLEVQARGRVADEPDSTRRAELDARWSPPVAAPQPAPEPEPAPAPKRDRIVTKWYFWLTVASITASAAAIAGVAIQAATDDSDDAVATRVGRSPLPAPARGPALLRF